MIETVGPATSVLQSGPAETAMREAALALETQFLKEMLTAAGLGESRGDFGGGAGEAQFSSFLVEAQAEQMARAGGIGLSQAIFELLVDRSGGA